MHTLPIPRAVKDDENAVQMIQVWIAKRGVHVTVRIGQWDDHASFDEEHGWGCLLSDAVYHVANAIQEEKGTPAAVTRQRIKEYFLSELESPSTGHLGSFVRDDS